MNAQLPFSHVAILGPGLLGGSVAMGLRRVAPGVRLNVWGRRREAVEEIARMQIADVCSSELRPVVENADLIVLCMPVEAMPGIAREIRNLVAHSTVVTDVGSVKAAVVRDVRDALAGSAQFIGSHPMAGSEQAGIEAARDDLFEGAVCIITPVGDEAPEDVSRVERFWKLFGARLKQLSPEEHDEAVSLVSHLPHLLAASLTDLVAERNPEALALCGNGFRDSTRIASGPPAMWAGIFQGNRNAVRTSLDAMIEKLRHFATLLERSDDEGMRELLERAKVARDRLKL